MGKAGLRKKVWLFQKTEKKLKKIQKRGVKLRRLTENLLKTKKTIKTMEMYLDLSLLL